MYCLITGGSRGLGIVLAQHFWNAGFNLVLAARNKSSLAKIQDQLKSCKDQNAFFLGYDFSDAQAVEEFTIHIKQLIPKLDVMINNAAIQGPIGSTWENDMETWRSTLQVNLLAPVALCRAFVPWMAETGGGSIINLSGGGATGPRSNFSAYATAKAGLVRFGETLAEEAKLLGVRINCIAPGAMKTAMLAEVLNIGIETAGSREYGLAEKVFHDGGASMDRVAALCLFLASDAAKGITGKLISAIWDDWEDFPNHLSELQQSDVYTLRRIVAKDRGFSWGDK